MSSSDSFLSFWVRLWATFVVLAWFAVIAGFGFVMLSRPVASADDVRSSGSISFAVDDGGSRGVSDETFSEGR